MSISYMYDVFISYSHADKTWVRGWLLPRLEAAQLRVCIDYRDFAVGVPSLINMEQAVDNSRHTLLILTPAWVASAWTAFEALLIQTTDPAARRQRLLPLMLEKCQPPLRITMLTYADFTQPEERATQLQRVLAIIRGGQTQKESAKTVATSPSVVIEVTRPPLAAIPVGRHWKEIGIQPVAIPGGRFLYGEAKTSTHVDAFRIGETPVTNTQYAAFVAATGYPPPHYWMGGGPSKGRAHHPVINVSWDDVQAFCRWAGGRLPSELEWEKASRGTDGRVYPWGNDWRPDACNNAATGRRDTTPVDQFPQGASPYAVLDMAGNVWEWCADWYDNTKTQRVLRGGSFHFSYHSLGCLPRYRHFAASCSPDFGFRIVVSND